MTEPQSPFLSGTNIQFAIDSTSLELFKRCPRLYQYQLIEGWVTKGEAIHLRFGIEYHQALHDYENSKVLGIPHDDAVFDTIRALLERISGWNPQPTTNSEGLKSREFLIRTVVWYLDEFKDDPAKTYIMTDGRPAIEVSFRFELDWGPINSPGQIHSIPKEGPVISILEMGQPYLLCGHLDRIVEFQGDLWVMDRKTTTSTPSTYYFNQFDPNNQMTLYSLASKVVMESPMRGVIIDAAQVAVGFSRFTRSFTYRTQDRIDEWMSDLRFWLVQMESCAISNSWPQNDTACDKFGGCRFRSICSKSPQVRERFLKSDFIQQPKEERWNPLKSR